MLSCFVVVATNLHDKRRIQDEYLLTSSDSLPARHTTEQSTRGIGGGGGGEAGVLFALATRCLAAGSVRDAARWLHAVPARHAAHVVPAPRLRGCTPRCLTGCAAHSALRLAAAQATRKHTPAPRKTRGARAKRQARWDRKRVWVPSTLYGAGNRRSGNRKSLYKRTAISHSDPMRSQLTPSGQKCP